MTKVHAMLWHIALMFTTLLLPCHLAGVEGAAGGASALSVMGCFSPVWLYAIGSVMWAWSRCASAMESTSPQKIRMQ